MLTGGGLLLALGLGGCLTVRTEHKVEPIHITIDVNLKVQRELDNFFADLDRASATREPPAATANPSTSSPHAQP